MRASRLTPLAALGLVLCSLVPAQAASRPQISDPCGDAATSVSAQGQRQQVEQSAGARDLRSAQVSVSAQRVLQATIETCGPVSAAVGYAASWLFSDGCWMELGYAPRRALDASLAPQVSLREKCPKNDSTPVAGSQPRLVFLLQLPADHAVLQGSAAHIAVPVSLVPAVSQHRFARGTSWPATGAMAFDPELALEAFALGSFQKPDVLVSVRFDLALGRAYTVGR